jgi:hypothetical protein
MSYLMLEVLSNIAREKSMYALYAFDVLKLSQNSLKESMLRPRSITAAIGDIDALILGL